MWRFIQEINEQGITVVLTTHYLEEAESLCRNIAIINHGTIIENTTMKEFLNKLHVETFIMDLKTPLKKRINRSWISYRDDTTLEVTIDRKRSLNKAIKVIDDHGGVVLSMRNKTNRLEELFMRLVEG